MSDLSSASTEELAQELTRRSALPHCPCGRWRTYMGSYDADGYTIRCYGCLRSIAKCRCAGRR